MRKCNICGKEFDMWDEQQKFDLNFDVLYGSKHDGEKINCSLCCECFDNLIDEYILPKCSINPVVQDADF